MAKNFYETLGVSRTANEKEIRSTYRKLARKHHPDVNPNDRASEARFKEINAAYEVLSDPDKRKKYDKYGDRWEMADQIEEAQKRQSAGSWARQGGPGAGFGDAMGGGAAISGRSSTTFSGANAAALAARPPTAADRISRRPSRSAWKKPSTAQRGP